MTIKEIAKLAGVSVGTAHSALHGKTSVSEATRQKVLRVAREHHYHVNATAAALKRKPRKVAVVIPELTSENRYFCNSLWAALNDYKSTIKEFQILFEEMSYSPRGEALSQLLSSLGEAEEIAGVICFSAYRREEIREGLHSFARQGKPAVLVGERDLAGDCLCSIAPDYEISGRMVGELLLRQLHSPSEILVCAGEETLASHYEVADGLENYLKEQEAPHQVLRLHYGDHRQKHYEELCRLLRERDRIGACFAVTARESVLLGQALAETGRAGTLPAIGSDLFPETAEFLQQGVFTNLLNKNPYAQMLQALECMVNALARGMIPKQKESTVGTEILFQSSLPLYRQGESGRLIL